MKQNESFFSRNSLIYVVPFLVIIWGLYSYFTSLPFYVKGIDPEYPYLINGLNCALLKFGQIGHTDHPGTPFQLYNGFIIRIVHLLAGKDSIAVDVLSRPEFYLGAISISLTILPAALVLLIGKIGIKSHRIINVIILQLTLFYHSILLDLFERCNPDRFLSIVTLLFIIVLLKFLFTEKPNHLKFAVWLGVVMGLGFATKINYLPLLIFSLFLLSKWKYRGIYAISGVFSFTLFISPVLGKFQEFKRFVLGVVNHDGLYGSGDERVFNLEKVIANTKTIFTSNPELLIIMAFLVFAIIVVIRKPENRKRGMRFMVGYLVLILIQLIMVTKHYKNYYMVPLFSTYGIFLFGTVFLSARIMDLKKAARVVKYSLPVIFFSLTSFQILKVGPKVRESNKYRAEAALFVKDYIDKNDYWFVEPTWKSGPQVENALVYGFSYCADRVKYEDVLRKVYPHVITSVENSNSIKFWHSTPAKLDTVICSGRKIYILSTPSRHADRLINVLKDEAAQLNISVSLDTIFKQPLTQTYILEINPELRANKTDTNPNYLRFKYPNKQTEYEREVERFMQEIKNSPKWLSAVEDKAKIKGIPLDSMIYLDAVYMAKRH